MRFGVLFLFLALFSRALLAQTPTNPSTNISFLDTYCDRTTVSWTSGNGSDRIVIVSEGSALSTLPSNNTYYLANDTFGKGHSFSATEYVVYNGNGNSMFIRNLKQNTTYYVSIFEYNGGGTVFNYLTSSYPEAQFTTEWINADFVIDNPYQCENVDSFNFNSTVTQSGSESITYDWKFGDGVKSTIPNPNHIYSSFGIFDVSLTVSTTGCKTTAVRQDTVAPLPQVSFNLDTDSINNSQIQCFYNASGRTNRFAFANFSTLANLPGNRATVDWKYGDGTISNSFRGSKVYNAPGVYNVVLVLNASMNNGKNQCIDSASMTVTVKPLPIDSNNVIFSDSAQCFNGNQFYFDHLNSDMSTTNLWFFGDGATGSGRNVIHSYNSVGKFEVKLEVTDTAGCYAEFADTVEIIAQPNNFYTGLDSNYCLGADPITVTPNIPGGTYEGDNIDATTGEFDPSMLGRNSISYIVQVGACADTFTARTTVNDLPVFEIGGDTSICAGTSFTKSVVKGDDAILWSTGSVDSFTSINSAQQVWVQKSKLGCTYRDTFNVSVINAPFFELGNDSLLCGGGIINVDVTADKATYNWNDGYPGGARSISTTGFYKVSVSNKCGTYTDSVDLEFLPYACEIFIPNAFSPNADNLNDVFKPTGTVELESIEIYNRWGKQLYQQSGPDLSWDGMLNGEPVEMGYYYFIIRYIIPEEGKSIKRLSAGEVYVVY